ncbi:MAG: hypothetical protein JW754_00735 [Candidatus Aenigmarchaeota archaeon]|nr:hypothetical protein [Candidatus Aenigmarchaeota archaeon]
MGDNISIAAVIILIISFLIAGVSVSSGAMADLTCDVIQAADCGSDTELLQISRETGGHAELPDQDHYSWLLCCGSTTNNILNTESDYEATFLMLSGNTNAHVEKTDMATPAYAVPAKIYSDNGIPECGYAENECPSDEECLLSISGPTNAHVGNCEAFGTKVCCKLGSDTFGIISFEDPTPADSETVESSRVVINVSIEKLTNPDISRVWVVWTDLSDPSNPTDKEMTFDFSDGETYYYNTEFTGLQNLKQYSFEAHARNANNEEIDIGPRTITISISLSVDFQDPTPPDKDISIGNSILINVSAYNQSTKITSVWATLYSGTGSTTHPLTPGKALGGGWYNYYTEIAGLANDPFANYNYTVFVQDDVGTKVNTTNRTITLTTLLISVDAQDTLNDYVEDYAVDLDLSYVDIGGFTEECYLKNDDGEWVSEPCASGIRPNWDLPAQNGNHTIIYNVSVGPVSMNASDWIVVDDLPPVSNITTPVREYLYEETMIDLAWDGEDQNLSDDTEGIGVDCYTLQYMITNAEGIQVAGWTDLGSCDPGTSLDDINLVSMATTHDPTVNDPEDIDMWKFSFRTISQDLLGNTEPKTTEDWSTTVFFPKYADIRVFTDYGEVPISGGMASANSPVTLSIKSKHAFGINVIINYSLTSPNQGLVWQQKICNNLILGDYCNVTIPAPNQDKELNFWVFSAESADPTNHDKQEYSPPGAPNAYWTVYLFKHPVAEFLSGDLYLTIGSHYVIPAKVRNILNQDSPITLSLGGFFGQYAKFLVDGQTLGYGEEWTETFNRQEERTISVEIAGADLTTTTTTLELTGSNPPLTDIHSIGIDVSLPSEFPGLNMVGIVMLMVFSVMVYYIFGTRRN